MGDVRTIALGFFSRSKAEGKFGGEMADGKERWGNWGDLEDREKDEDSGIQRREGRFAKNCRSEE
jgi:hypothetical protein